MGSRLTFASSRELDATTPHTPRRCPHFLAFFSLKFLAFDSYGLLCETRCKSLVGSCTVDSTCLGAAELVSPACEACGLRVAVREGAISVRRDLYRFEVWRFQADSPVFHFCPAFACAAGSCCCMIHAHEYSSNTSSNASSRGRNSMQHTRCRRCQGCLGKKPV